MKTYGDIYLAARKRLRESGDTSSDLDARLLSAKASGKTVENFLKDARLYVVDDSFEKALNELVERRLEGEPAAYITGEWEFHGMPMKITEDVLIPRDDTEILVDKAIELLKPKGPDTRVLDLCCGSGCVGLSIAGTLRGCRIVMADISDKALAVSRANMLMNSLTKNVTCLAADARQNPPMLLGWFDLIVCNPPYIPTGELPELDSSVKDFEPHLALDGGEDGLDFFRDVASKWTEILKTGGTMMFECGDGQSSAVADILRASGFTEIKIYKDTQGIERVVSGKYFRQR